MGRPKKELDPLELFDMLALGKPQAETAEDLGVSIPTLEKRIGRIQEQQSVLLQYRTLQSLELTSLQSRILEAITPDKIAEAPLRDLVLAFKILKDKEHLIEGKPSEIKGLVGYLIEMEKEQIALNKTPRLNGGENESPGEEIEDAEFESLPDL